MCSVLSFKNSAQSPIQLATVVYFEIYIIF